MLLQPTCVIIACDLVTLKLECDAFVGFLHKQLLLYCASSHIVVHLPWERFSFSFPGLIYFWHFIFSPSALCCHLVNCLFNIVHAEVYFSSFLPRDFRSLPSLPTSISEKATGNTVCSWFPSNSLQDLERNPVHGEHFLCSSVPVWSCGRLPLLSLPMHQSYECAHTLS